MLFKDFSDSGIWETTYFFTILSQISRLTSKRITNSHSKLYAVRTKLTRLRTKVILRKLLLSSYESYLSFPHESGVDLFKQSVSSPY